MLYLDLLCSYSNTGAEQSVAQKTEPRNPRKIYCHRRDGVVVRTSALQSVDLGSFPQVESFQKTLKK